MNTLKCITCEEVMNYNDEVVFDNDELKTVDESNPDWAYCECIECYYKEEME